MEEFEKDPTESNTIRFNKTKLEDLIGAESGQSKCCDVCGENECRTVEFEGNSYENVPAELIIKAGLIAASRL